MNKKATKRGSMFTMNANPLRGVEEEYVDESERVAKLTKEMYDLRQTLEKVVAENRELKKKGAVNVSSPPTKLS